MFKTLYVVRKRGASQMDVKSQFATLLIYLQVYHYNFIHVRI